MHKQATLSLFLLGMIALAGCTAPETTDTSTGRDNSLEADAESDDDSTDQTQEQSKTNDKAEMTFGAENTYRDGIGYFHVVGEVENTGTRNGEYTKISATFYDESGAVYDTAFSYASREIIPAGEKSPYEVSVEDSDAKITDYKISVSTSTTSSDPVGYGSLVVQGDTGSTNSLGNYQIVGEVQNNADRQATYVKVISSMYDADDQIVGVDFTYTDPSDIEGGSSAGFKITNLRDDVAVESYELWVEASGMR